MANVNVNEVVLRDSNDLVRAIDMMLLQMDKRQRKSFLSWVKQRRNRYDFAYPQGYVPPAPAAEEPKVEIVRPEGVDESGKVEIIKP